MASCLIALSLRDSAPEIEKPSHPSYKRWHKSLALLRDLSPEKPNIEGDSYCCVDEEHPGDVVYLYRKWGSLDYASSGSNQAAYQPISPKTHSGPLRPTVRPRSRA